MLLNLKYKDIIFLIINSKRFEREIIKRGNVECENVEREYIELQSFE